jgi:septum site-determining protein MinC
MEGIIPPPRVSAEQLAATVAVDLSAKSAEVTQPVEITQTPVDSKVNEMVNNVAPTSASPLPLTPPQATSTPPPAEGTTPNPLPSTTPTVPAVAPTPTSATTPTGTPTTPESPAFQAFPQEPAANHPPIDPRQMVRWQNEDGKIQLHLPAEITGGLTLAELWLQIQLRLNAGERFWQAHTPVELFAGRRLMDQRQLQTLAELLSQSQLSLKRVHTLRRQTAIAAAMSGYAVEQEPVVAPLTLSGPSSTLPSADPLYLETTLRSGTEICHPGSVIIVGDLNPGSSIVADGDIVVWGRLRGTVHAGAQGNRRCRIMALQMEATQLRIADQIARAPKPPVESYPEVAYVTPEGIRLTRAIMKKEN